MNTSLNLLPALAASVIAFSVPSLDARTWTETGTGRTIEGEFIEMAGETVVIKRSGDRTVKIPLARVSVADRAFVAKQAAEPDTGATEGGSLEPLVPPVTVKPLPITGEGKERKAGLEYTNTGKRDIKSMNVDMHFLRGDGSIGKGGIPHSGISFHQKPGKLLRPGKKHTEPISSFFMEDDTKAVDGTVTEITFADGSTWPTVPSEPPPKNGDDPVSGMVVGVIGSGEMAAPVTVLFNHGSKAMIGVQYIIEYLDGSGSILAPTAYGYGSDTPFMEPGERLVQEGGDPPPEGATVARVKVTKVEFPDKSKWTPDKKQDPAPEVPGRNTEADKPDFGPNALRIKVYLDDRDVVKVSGKQLWYEHQSGSFPGKWNNHDDPTYVNGREWVPMWEGMTSKPYDRLTPPFRPPSDSQVKIAHKEGRGSVSILEQPTKENNQTLSLQFEDPTGGAAWLEVVISWK